MNAVLLYLCVVGICAALIFATWLILKLIEIACDKTGVSFVLWYIAALATLGAAQWLVFQAIEKLVA
jgi:hypothetical protein